MSGVYCYRNLNRKGIVYSVKSNRTGRVLARKEYVLLENAEMRINQNGRQRALRSGKRNQHAGIKGKWIRSHFETWIRDTRTVASDWIRIYYNPDRAGTFTDDRGEPVDSAKYVVLTEDGVWCLPY